MYEHHVACLRSLGKTRLGGGWLSSWLFWCKLERNRGVTNYIDWSSNHPFLLQGPHWHGFDGFGQTHQFPYKDIIEIHILTPKNTKVIWFSSSKQISIEIPNEASVLHTWDGFGRDKRLLWGWHSALILGLMVHSKFWILRFCKNQFYL